MKTDWLRKFAKWMRKFVRHAMVPPMHHEAAVEWRLTALAAVAQAYRIIERWGLRRVC